MEINVQKYIEDLNNLEELEKTYDLALTSNILYGWKQDLSLIFKKINKILNPGGIFISNHFFSPTMKQTDLHCLMRIQMFRWAALPVTLAACATFAI